MARWLIVISFLWLVGASPPHAEPVDELAAGKLLVAIPEMNDPNFSHTVVLILRHGPEGAIGLVLNRPTTVGVAEIFSEIEGMQRRRDRIYAGGPVERGSVWILIWGGDDLDDAQRLLDNVYFSQSRELLGKLAASDHGQELFRVYAGYAGWAAGQLENEVRHGGWTVIDGDAPTIFQDAAEEIWRSLVPRDPSKSARLNALPGPRG